MYADVKTAQRSQPNSAEKTLTMLQTKKPKTMHDLIMLCVVWRAAKKTSLLCCMSAKDRNMGKDKKQHKHK
jgi:hypothetical protein